MHCGVGLWNTLWNRSSAGVDFTLAFSARRVHPRGENNIKYLPTAVRQLEFAMKLWHYVESGKMDFRELDEALTILDGGGTHYVLPTHLFEGDDDFRNAVANNIGISFGAAAITLNRCREEAGVDLADPILTDLDQWVGLVYQIRNAFAHDIAEPVWAITRARFRRVYEVAGVRADLTNLHGVPFQYAHIGGAQALLLLADYGAEVVFRPQFRAIHELGLHWSPTRDERALREDAIGPADEPL